MEVVQDTEPHREGEQEHGLPSNEGETDTVPYCRETGNLSKNSEARMIFCNRMLLRIKARIGYRMPVKLKALAFEDIWFEDEKVFRLEWQVNKQNQRVWLSKHKTKREHLQEPEGKEALTNAKSQWQKATGVMIAIAANYKHGLTEPVVVPPDLKVNAKYYQELLQSHFIPWALSSTGPGFVWQHDNAPSHTARSVRDYLGECKRKFNMELLPWPANSPDLQPLDYHVWALIANKADNNSTVEELTASTKAAVADINSKWPEHLKAMQSWAKRLRLCAAARGGHFEHR